MSVVHNLTGYDKRTEFIAYRHRVPADKLRQAKEFARVPSIDPDAIGSYPLLPQNARRLAWAIGLNAIDVDRYDWFLEPSEDMASIDVKRRAAGEIVD